MTPHELQVLVADALQTVREMDATTRQLAVDSGVLDRRVAQNLTAAADTRMVTSQRAR